MRCPNCGNQEYELIDYSIARCTNCYSLWDPYLYPGFPVPNVEVGEIWDTSEDEENLVEDEIIEDASADYSIDNDQDLETDEIDDWDTDQEDDDVEDDSDDWNDENDDGGEDANY